MSDSEQRRPIDYIPIAKVELGGFDPGSVDYYSSTAYRADQRTEIYIPLLGADDVGVFPNYERLAMYELFDGKDIIGKRDKVDELNVDTFVQRYGKATMIPESKYSLERDELAYQNYYLYPTRNPSTKYGYLAMCGYFLSTLGSPLIWGSAFIAYLLDNSHGWKTALGYFKVAGYAWLGSVAVWKIFGYLAQKTDNGKWAYMNRRTGMVVLPRKQAGPPIEIPYKEFEPRIFRSTGSEGEFYHGLVYVHKSGRWSFGAGETFYADSYLRAVYLEQFMDITQPLPDIPPLEQYRDKDPTTVAYDKLTHRNPRYWRDKTEEEIAQIAKECLQRNLAILGESAYRV